MEVFEQKNVLDSMEILIDTREQPSKRAERRYESFGVPYERATLSYGDYCYNAVLPSGEPLYDRNRTLTPLCVVERKMNLDELAQCLTRSRERFKREFERAQEQGARIFLVVENASWENLLNGKYRTRMTPAAFEGSLMAWIVRYDLGLIFCKEETSGRLIKDLLYRDLKERLERGDLG